MATFTQLPSGNWRVQIRRKQSYASDTFRRYVDAKRAGFWARMKAASLTRDFGVGLLQLERYLTKLGKSGEIGCENG